MKEDFDVTKFVKDDDSAKDLYEFDKDKCVLPEEKMYEPVFEDVIQKNNDSTNLVPSPPNTGQFEICNTPMVCSNLENDLYRVMVEVSGVPLSPEQKQKLKYRIAKSAVDNHAKLVSKAIDFNYAINLMRARNATSSYIGQAVIDENGIVVAQSNPRQISESEMIEKFISDKFLVKERNHESKDGYRILQRNNTLNRHEQIAKEDLKIDFGTWLCSLRPDIDIPQSVMDKMFKTLLYKINCVDDLAQERKILKMDKFSIATLDGYYDIKKNIFTKKENMAGRIFNKTSLPINFLEEDVEPEEFSKLLKATFGNAEKIITVVYEYIGAMLSGIPIIKKIFVFQGVSNSGKSRLSRIIASCFHEGDIVYIDKLTDLKDDINFDKAGIILIDELSDKKLNPSQVSKLKKLSNGNKQVKILATTNHPIVTESDGSIDKALYNRLAVIPFENVMDNSTPEVSAYEDVYLEMERDAIVSKALKAFHKVLARSENISNLQFSADFPLNYFVETKVFPNKSEQLRIDSERIQEVLREKNQNPPDEDIFTKVIAELYEVTDEVNPEITAESVMQTVNDILKVKDALEKNIFNDVQSFGKKLKFYYGDKLRSERRAGKVCYNLQYRQPNSNKA